MSMSKGQRSTERAWHRRFAVECFNVTWALLEKEDRTPGEAEEMIHAAHAARFHWGKIGMAVNFARGEWQIARVYATLGRGEPALHHAQRCLATCEEHHIGDFDLAYAYESLARAYAIKGRPLEATRYLQLAGEAGEEIVNRADRDALLGDLQEVQEFLSQGQQPGSAG
jgi:tetratricopeptide (TPR) repeat protein